MDIEQIFGWAGFFVALGVLLTPALTAYKMLRAGTVGSMTITFFLFVFMNCVNMTTYGILTNNLQLMLCNIYGTCSATFAIRTYLSLLQERVISHKQQKVVNSVMGGSSLNIDNTNNNNATNGTSDANNGSPSPKRLNAEIPPSAVASPVELMDMAISATLDEKALEAELQYAKTLKQTMLFCGIDLFILFIVLVLTVMAFPSYASSLCGFAATTMGTIMFSGPLDQIGWILKHKSSAPLEPMIMLAAAANSVCWGAYGLITLDPWLIFPNTCGLALAVIQALLLMWYPRNSAAAASKRNVDAAAIDALHGGDEGAVTVADLDRVIAETQAGATRPSFVST